MVLTAAQLTGFAQFDAAEHAGLRQPGDAQTHQDDSSGRVYSYARLP